MTSHDCRATGITRGLCLNGWANSCVALSYNWECKGILIGPSFFFRPPRFRHCLFHSLSKSRSRLRAQISRRGWQADVTFSRVCQTRTPGPAGASFEWNFVDFVETTPGSGCSQNHFYGNRVRTLIAMKLHGGLQYRRRQASTTPHEIIWRHHL
jgi:hypothetical protein